MRQFTPAQNVPHFNSLRAVTSIFPTLVVTALLLLLSLIVPPNSFADSTPFPLAATVGSGPDESYLVLNFATGPGETNVPSDDVAFGYLWGGVSNPDPTAWDMINDLTSAGIGLSNESINYGPQLGIFVSEFSYNGLSNNANTDIYGNFWNYYQAGDQYPLSPTNPYVLPSGGPIASTDNLTSAEDGIWSDSNYAPSAINLTDGSVDGWVFGQYNAANPVLPTGSSAPAPEASTFISMLAGLVLIVGFVIVKRRTSVECN